MDRRRQIHYSAVDVIKVGDVLVSEEAVVARFACDLSACLGACCRVGDAGAPLAAGEAGAIERALPSVAAALPAENQRILEQGGFLDRSDPGKDQLACFPDGRCVFSYGGLGGALGCGLEAAHLRGVSEFRKPIFCHLFPLRVGSFYGQLVLNTERRPECGPGWDGSHGLLESSRDALIRLFGASWYDELLAAAREERRRLLER